MVRDAFPLPWIDEALQAIHSSNWFTSFDLTQGYLQLAMEEDDLKETAFRARSSGLYEFTCMPFGLLNADSSFCCLMEQCLGYQQFVTLLLYLDNICVFALNIDGMLDHTELVFNWLKNTIWRLSLKCHFIDTIVLFWGHVELGEYLLTLRKWKKVWDWPTPPNAKEAHSFLGLASYYRWFIPKFAWHGPLFAWASWSNFN